MKIFPTVILGVTSLFSFGLASGSAQEPLESLGPEQVEMLVAPIALYPDPLVALILPASTRPSDIVLAARFLERGGVADAVTNEMWDDSVKALTRYGEVLAYLDENLEWTRSLGDAFLAQPADVMNAIQAVRARARNSGLLANTNEQEIFVDETEIRILPARSTVIYVPRYDPEILYVSHDPFHYGVPFLTFGIGYHVGAWLSYDCDWRYRTVRVVHRPVSWYYQPDWRTRYYYHDRSFGWTTWAPSPRHDRRFDRSRRSPSDYVLRPNRHWESSRQSRIATTSTRDRDRDGSRDWQQSPRPRSEVGAVRHDRSRSPDNWRDRQTVREPNQPALIASEPTAPVVHAQPPRNHGRRSPAVGNSPRYHNDAATVQASPQRNYRGPAAAAVSAPPISTSPARAVANPGRRYPPPPAAIESASESSSSERSGHPGRGRRLGEDNSRRNLN